MYSEMVSEATAVKLKAWCQTTSPTLEFDDETHTYTVNGTKFLSVSKLISPWNTNLLNKLDPNHADYDQVFATQTIPNAQLRGKEVHAYLEAFETNQPLPTVVTDINPLLKQWEWQMKLYGKNLVLLGAEITLTAPTYHVAGTIDRLYYDTKTHELVLLDIKSGGFHDVTYYQMASYDLLLRYHGVVVDKTVVLTLKPNLKKWWHVVPPLKLRSIQFNKAFRQRWTQAKTLCIKS